MGKRIEMLTRLTEKEERKALKEKLERELVEVQKEIVYYEGLNAREQSKERFDKKRGLLIRKKYA
jgi:hypothetical protein|tara:strand:+ start:807 stop:1001 length:195 start_codon:yes stop_codon:yes gene_type:complete